MKRYHDIAGDGGSRVLEQVAEYPHQRRARRCAPSGGRGLWQGGVGKSTLTLHLAGALRARGLPIAILARGMRTIQLPKVHPAEFSSDLLETFGFRPVGRHLLYAAGVQSD